MDDSSDAAAAVPTPDPAEGGGLLLPRGADPHQAMITMPVRQLLRRDAAMTAPSTTIRATAQLMREQRATAAMLVEGDALVGIVTDRDLRNRVLAAGLDAERAIAEVATTSALASIDVRASAFDALLLMTRRDVHHLPVLDGHRVVGLLTASDLAEVQATSAVVIAGEIQAQSTLEGLQRASSHVRQLQRALAVADATARASGQIITAITDAMTVRLLQLAEAALGPPPVPYAWVAAGSQGRGEQTAKSDQDNCLILDDSFDEARHGEYFAALSAQVCAGLDACGYVYCPGEMMAMSAKWRRTRRHWQQTFAQWIDEPEPMALMLTSVFFDMRLVHGQAVLVEEVAADALRRTRGNAFFLSYMARNALTRRPPLGLFGGIATARSGDHRGTVDLKMQGIVPIVELARVYALAGGHAQVNTWDRLEVAVQSHEVSEQGSRDLCDALELLACLRIRHQVRQLDAGLPLDNKLALDELSSFQRKQMHDAFVVVQRLQDVLEQRYRI